MANASVAHGGCDVIAAILMKAKRFSLTRNFLTGAGRRLATSGLLRRATRPMNDEMNAHRPSPCSDLPVPWVTSYTLCQTLV